ncbi:MAG TPA: hypothetical protein VNQ73_09215 [Ilumatobacter sp.]|nr:hypothetical protein [Ilumatobacter sp.]
MASIIDQATDALAGHLQPGEQVVAATRAQLDGNTVRFASAQAIGGIAGAVAAGWRFGDDVTDRLRRGAAVAVTDRRVVVFDVTAMGANPKNPVLIVDRAEVSDVVAGSKRIMLVKAPTFGFTVVDAGGERLDLRFEVAKVQAKTATAVVAELQR